MAETFEKLTLNGTKSLSDQVADVFTSFLADKKTCIDGKEQSKEDLVQHYKNFSNVIFNMTKGKEVCEPQPRRKSGYLLFCEYHRPKYTICIK